MIDQAQAVAQRLREEYCDAVAREAAKTIDALCAEVGRMTKEHKKAENAKVDVEPGGFWQGEFSKGGGAVLYEVPQESVFGRKYLNAPLYPASALAALRAENERLKIQGEETLSTLHAQCELTQLADKDLRTQLAQAQEELHDERNRGLALLADAKEWQRQFNAAQADVYHARADERTAMSHLSEARKALGVDCDFPTMIAQIAEAQADAARYRWLWNNAHNVSFNYQVNPITKATVMGLHCGSLTDTIDAAMQGETK